MFFRFGDFVIFKQIVDKDIDTRLTFSDHKRSLWQFVPS